MQARQSLLVIVDARAFGFIGLVARCAKEQGIATAIIRPSGSILHNPQAFAVDIVLDEITVELLHKVLSELDKDYHIVGLTSYRGDFTPQGLLGAIAAQCAEERGLPSQSADALYRANNKFLTREALRAARVADIDFGHATDADTAVEHAERIGYPVILKPLTGVGSNLILKCDDAAQVRKHFALALDQLPRSYYPMARAAVHQCLLRSGGVREFNPVCSMLVEQYIPGPELSVECVVGEDTVLPLLVHDKVQMREAEHIFFEDVLVVPSDRFTHAQTQVMKDYAAAVIRAVGLKNCICHVELRWHDKLESPRLLELNPRIGGGCVAESLTTMLHFEPYQAILELALGTFQPQPPRERTTERHSMIFLFSPYSGRLKEIVGLELVEQLPGVLSVSAPVAPGSLIGGDFEEVFLVNVWLKSDSSEHAKAMYRKIAETIHFDIERT